MSCVLPDQEAALLTDEIQVGFLHPPINASLNLYEIYRESMMVALPEDHFLAKQPRLSIKDLAQESFILFPQSIGPNLHRQIMTLCAQAGFTPKVVQEAIPQPTMIGLVAANIGVAFVSSSLQSISRSGVAYRTLQEPMPILSLAAAWKVPSPSEAGVASSEGNTLFSHLSPIVRNFLTTVEAWSISFHEQ
jgi:DNA-binding transcriptional LysR family regulator